jgi:Domain of unknown function (DUF3806)
VDATTSPLTDVEQEWVRSQLAAATRFVADYGSQRHTAGLEALDHAWASWLDRQSVDPEDPNTVVNAVGVAFGQALVETLEGFTWVIAADEAGRDLAVFGLPGTGDVLVYPANVVAKRYESREPWFLQATHDAIVAEVRQLRG